MKTVGKYMVSGSAIGTLYKLKTRFEREGSKAALSVIDTIEYLACLRRQEIYRRKRIYIPFKRLNKVVKNASLYGLVRYCHFTSFQEVKHQDWLYKRA